MMNRLSFQVVALGALLILFRWTFFDDPFRVCICRSSVLLPEIIAGRILSETQEPLHFAILRVRFALKVVASGQELSTLFEVGAGRNINRPTCHLSAARP